MVDHDPGRSLPLEHHGVARRIRDVFAVAFVRERVGPAVEAKIPVNPHMLFVEDNARVGSAGRILEILVDGRGGCCDRLHRGAVQRDTVAGTHNVELWRGGWRALSFFS